jgi:hypothetical protein
MSERTQQNIVFENIWQKDRPELHRQIKDHWEQLFAIDPAEIEKRIKEVVFVIHDGGGSVAGISTARKVFVKQLKNYLYGVRFMISPGYRIPGLMSKLVMQTRDFLEEIHKEDQPHPCIGLIVLVENEHMKKQLRAPALASGFVYIGNSSAGHHVRVYYFKGSHITQQ